MTPPRKPQDATLRNIRAAKKRLDDLEARVRVLEDYVRANAAQTNEVRRMREEQDY